LLGVIFGVATVIVVVSLIEGFNAYVDEKIANIGTNAFAVQKFSIDISPASKLSMLRGDETRMSLLKTLKRWQLAGARFRMSALRRTLVGM